MKTIELKKELQDFVKVTDWKGNEDKDRKDLTLKDIDRTNSYFGGLVRTDGSLYEHIVGGIPKEVIRAEVGIGFSVKDGIFKLEDRPLTEAEQTLLFDAVCDQLFKKAGLSRNKENNYRDFLSRHMHQNALYQQSVKYLEKQLDTKSLLMKIESYNPKLFFKDGALYVHEVVTSAKLFDSSGETQSGSIAAETFMKIEMGEERDKVKLTVQKFTVNYSSELAKIFEPIARTNPSVFSRFFSQASSSVTSIEAPRLIKAK